MPISPNEVYVYVYGTDACDRVVHAIDTILLHSDEKHYRLAESPGCIMYGFRVEEHLTESDCKLLRQAYKDAGWPAILVSNNASDTNPVCTISMLLTLDSGEPYSTLSARHGKLQHLFKTLPTDK